MSLPVQMRLRSWRRWSVYQQFFNKQMHRKRGFWLISFVLLDCRAYDVRLFIDSISICDVTTTPAGRVNYIARNEEIQPRVRWKKGRRWRGKIDEPISSREAWYSLDCKLYMAVRRNDQQTGSRRASIVSRTYFFFFLLDLVGNKADIGLAFSSRSAYLAVPKRGRNERGRGGGGRRQWD